MESQRWLGPHWLLLAGLTALIGCGTAGPSFPTVKVAGAVTIDKKPVASGNITFMPQGTNAGQPISQPIKEGKYETVAVPKGQLKVTITATEPTGEMDNSRTPAIPIVKNIVPTKYQSGIDVDINADNPSQNFELTP